jgi:hypothetical protein
MKTPAFICVLLLLIACRDEDTPCTDALNPKCPNYDPCLSFQPANADFVIIDSIYGYDCMDGRGRLDLVSEVDTAIAGGELYFRALHVADTYEWKVGTDPRIYHDRKFSLIFPASAAPADIDVSLIVCKEDTNQCQTILCDTLIKTFNLIFSDGFDTASLVIGKFRGIDTDSPLDSFTIEIPPPLPSLKGIINFPNGCTGQWLNVSLSRKGILIYRTPTFCQSACGIGYIMPDRKTLVIDYSVKTGDQRILKKFIGTRIE